MKFSEVCDHLSKRGFVRRVSQPNLVFFFGMDNLFYRSLYDIHKRTGIVSSVYNASLSDICAVDWQIINLYWGGTKDNFLPFEYPELLITQDDCNKICKAAENLVDEEIEHHNTHINPKEVDRMFKIADELAREIYPDFDYPDYVLEKEKNENKSEKKLEFKSITVGFLINNIVCEMKFDDSVIFKELGRFTKFTTENGKGLLITTSSIFYIHQDVNFTLTHRFRGSQ